MEITKEEERVLQSAALQTARSILHLRQRADQDLLTAKAELEAKTEELAHSLSMMRATLDSTTDGSRGRGGRGRSPTATSSSCGYGISAARHCARTS
jgi:predicted RNA-binding Zn ribbon-like protein